MRVCVWVFVRVGSCFDIHRLEIRENRVKFSVFFISGVVLLAKRAYMRMNSISSSRHSSVFFSGSCLIGKTECLIQSLFLMRVRLNVYFAVI